MRARDAFGLTADNQTDLMTAVPTAGRHGRLPLSHARTGSRLNPLAVALCLLGMSSAGVRAKDYFDPAFLGGGADGTSVDLSAFETPGGMAEGTFLADIYMNSQMQFTRQMRFVKDSSGKVGPVLTPDMLSHMGVDIARLPAFKGLPADKPVGDLTALIPGATVKFDMTSLRLNITVPQVDMDPDKADGMDPSLWDEGVPAALLNYNVNGSRTRSDGTSGMGGTHSDNMFAWLNGGLNAGAWRLRSSFSYSRNNMSGRNYSSTMNTSQFSNTYLQRDIQRLRSELTIGESSTGGDIFDPISFRGVQLMSQEQMRPSSQRGFAPVISGIARSNARVSVTRNGSLIYETNVPPGPFRLTDLNTSGNGGDLVVTVTEADGSKHVTSQAYSTLPVMKRPGTWDYEVTVAKYKNGGYTTGSSDPLFALTTLSVGLPHYVTLYGGLLGASRYQSVALGTGVSLGLIGAVSLDATLSRARLNDLEGVQQGAAFRAKYSKSMLTTGTTVDLSAYRYATSHYYTFRDAMSHGYNLQYGAAPWLGERERSTWQLTLSQTLGELGSLSLNASRRDYWRTDRVINSVGVSFSSSLKGVGYSVSYNEDHTQNSNDEWPTNRQVSLNVNVPFSLFSPNASALQNINATYSMTHDNQGRTQQQAGLAGTLLDNKLAWNASQSMANQGESSTGNLGASYQSGIGNTNVGYGYGGGVRTLSGGMSGAMVLHPHGLTLTSTTGDSMALVEAPGAAGVKVSSGNTSTNAWGYAVVPYMMSYQRNVVSLDPTTLPDGVDIPANSTVVYPTKGALVAAPFKTRVGRQAMLTLNVRGKPVPFGAMASLPGDDAQNAAIVGDGGMVYLTGAPQRGTLKVLWGTAPDQQCQVNYNLGALQKPDAKDPDAPAVNIVQQTLDCLSTGAPAPAVAAGGTVGSGASSLTPAAQGMTP
ncbi:fimbria/pilus outer membrane usher protein [Klebsiella aerogenes]|uniref:fimbria/pilus outer membrane usher protein n=1 Tax=Klebsiella aerogenes TaxID=548 RepID=UPI002FF9787D